MYQRVISNVHDVDPFSDDMAIDTESKVVPAGQVYPNFAPDLQRPRANSGSKVKVKGHFHQNAPPPSATSNPSFEAPTLFHNRVGTGGSLSLTKDQQHYLDSKETAHANRPLVVLEEPTETDPIRLLEQATENRLNLQRFLDRLHDSNRNAHPRTFHDWMETEDDYKTALAGFSSRKRAGSAPATSRSSPSSFLNRILGTQLAITSRTSTPTLGTIDYSGPPPAAPSHIDPTDHLGLAIHYHEQNSLTHSALHLRRSAIEDDHPVGHYLYAMALRNGWGVVPDPHAAFEHLVKAVDASFALMAGAIRNAERRASVGGAGERLRRSDTDYPKGRLEDRGATRSFGRSRFRDIVTLVRLAKVDDPQPAVEAARAIVPLPIYEVGMSFRHGWGVPVCEDAAAYYLTVAANLGDADACTELGYCYLHGRSGVPKSRLLAAKYLREAEKAGVKLVGESWIHKRKWGGTV